MKQMRVCLFVVAILVSTRAVLCATPGGVYVSPDRTEIVQVADGWHAYDGTVYSFEQTLRLWDTGQLPDGRFGYAARFWYLTSEAPRQWSAYDIPGPAIGHARFAENGDWVLANGSYAAFRRAGGQRRSTRFEYGWDFAPFSVVSLVDISADGRYIVAGSETVLRNAHPGPLVLYDRTLVGTQERDPLARGDAGPTMEFVTQAGERVGWIGFLRFLRNGRQFYVNTREGLALHNVDDPRPVRVAFSDMLSTAEDSPVDEVYDIDATEQLVVLRTDRGERDWSWYYSLDVYDLATEEYRYRITEDLHTRLWPGTFRVWFAANGEHYVILGREYVHPDSASRRDEQRWYLEVRELRTNILIDELYRGEARPEVGYSRESDIVGYSTDAGIVLWDVTAREVFLAFDHAE